MKLADFNYHLPEALIAQEPWPERDHSRMMVIDRPSGSLEHRHFYDFPEFLKEGDVLVVNNSRVLAARLQGRKVTGGKVEILLLSRNNVLSLQHETWEVLLKPAKGLRPGTEIFFSPGGSAIVKERLTEKKWRLDFAASLPFDEFLDIQGRPPLPPYIKRRDHQEKFLADRERYQTVYARIPGSIAAPTAGLHFTPRVLEALKKREIPLVQVTLHVGYGTFSPPEAEEVEAHCMEEERYEISLEAAETINGARRVIAVGTTCTRTIEAAADEKGLVKPGSASTDLFIYPGYRFKRVNALLTNFHLPKSTLYLLVCAFTGQDMVQGAYDRAISEGYRFYSYGDCMLIA